MPGMKYCAHEDEKIALQGLAIEFLVEIENPDLARQEAILFSV